MSEADEQGKPRQETNSPHPEGQGHPGGVETRPLSRGRVLIGVAVLMAIAVVLAVTGIVPRLHARTRLADDTNSLAAPNVQVLKPALGQPSSEVVLPGNIQAFTDTALYARTNGYLKKWYFDIGSHVKKGQLLAEIESPEIDQQLAQAQADLATAQANAGNAQTNAKRYTDLLKSDAVSQQDADTFNTQAASSNTMVKSAQANVQRLQELVSFEKIYAPFDGVVTARNVDTGQLITEGSGTELFHLAAINTLRVYINVPQVYSRVAVKGITADLTFSEYPGRKFQGKLVRTSDQIDPVSRTLLAEIDVDNRKGELLPGAYAEVHLKLKEQTPSYVVPVSALMYRSEGLRVGIVEGGNKARLVPITIGQDDGKTVQIISGLDANSQVIENPPDSLIDGELVQIPPPSQGQPGSAAPQGGQQAGRSGQASGSMGGQQGESQTGDRAPVQTPTGPQAPGQPPSGQQQSGQQQPGGAQR